MESHIDSQIDRIRAIFYKLKADIVQEQERSAALEIEAKRLVEELSFEKQKTKELQRQVESLMDRISTNEQEVNPDSSEKIFRKDEEIDALVREIEFCIQKLKNKHA
ncbi:MAG TPA: hypothetical protein DEF82_08670 [Crocinitomicaceae bacterium]|nr:hypothetical protein [Flavobacteriales bacterium]HBW86790.1 hypothetical protein [Crocinitomicaceae bacterium]